MTDPGGVGGFGLQWWLEVLVLPEIFQVFLSLAGGLPLQGSSLLGTSLINRGTPHFSKSSGQLPKPLAHSEDVLVSWEAKQT